MTGVDKGAGEFHVGHVSVLREARRHGDWLVVGVLADDTAASYKRRPIKTLAERVAVIEACRYFDEFGYGPAVAAGQLAYVRRTLEISTTQVIQRVLDASRSTQ